MKNEELYQNTHHTNGSSGTLCITHIYSRDIKTSLTMRAQRLIYDVAKQW